MARCQHVVLGGGTLYGCMYLGALIAMFGNDKSTYAVWASGIKSYAGSSVGALLACLLTVWDPWAIWDYVRTTGFRKIAESLFDQNILAITEAMSINSGAALERLLKQGMADLTGSADVTFHQLFQLTGKKLVVTVTNLRTGFAEYWSVATVPRMEVWRALRATSVMPFL